MFLYKLLLTGTDYLFPPSEDALLVRSIEENDMILIQDIHHTNNLYTLSAYTSRYIRALIHEAKFKDNTKAHVLLGILFTRFLSTYTKPLDIIIPIPLSSTRMRTRGYNQVLRILSKSKPPYTARIMVDILKRTRDTQPQTELTRDDRLHNLKDAFIVAKPECVHGKHIMLVDDVTTTGTTLRSAQIALSKHSPASITCVAIAH